MKCRNKESSLGQGIKPWLGQRKGMANWKSKMKCCSSVCLLLVSWQLGSEVWQIKVGTEMLYNGGSSLGLGREGRYGKSKLICEMPYGSVTASGQTAN